MIRGLIGAIGLSVVATHALAADPIEIGIGYLRHAGVKSTLSLVAQPADNDGVAGALLAIEDNNTTGRFLNQHFTLTEIKLKENDDVAAVAGSLADRDGLPLLAEIKGHATHSQEPQWFTTAPIPAIRKLLDKVGWSVGDVDLFEINEAFAVVPMAAQRDLGIPREKLNINGGACALGHPIGATGARLIVTLLHALEAHGLKRGVAALCIGGGEATAIAIERIVH